MDKAPLAIHKKEDLRITKTKNCLLEAFFTLMSQKTFNDITVNELCSLAGVRRATFYKHFSDKYDFLSQITSMLREDFDRNMLRLGKLDFTVDYFLKYTEALVDFLLGHEKVVDMILASEAKHALINIIVEQNFKDTKSRLEKGAAEGAALLADSDTIAAIITGGVGQAIYKWYESGKEMPRDELVSGIFAVIKKILK